MHKRQLLFFLFIWMFFQNGSLHAQSESNTVTYKGIDVGINMTSVISSFSGNGNVIDASDFPIIFRIGKRKLNLRVGLGAQGGSNETFDNITFSFRQSSFKEAALRLGFEKHLVVENKLNVYWGLDFIGRYKQNQVEIFGNNGSFNVLGDTSIGVGGGPLLGLRYQLSKRVYLSSEATLYGLVNFERYTESGDTPNIVVNTNSYDFSLQPPVLLYIKYKLLYHEK